jgi:hypothetical protein
MSGDSENDTLFAEATGGDPNAENAETELTADDTRLADPDFEADEFGEIEEDEPQPLQPGIGDALKKIAEAPANFIPVNEDYRIYIYQDGGQSKFLRYDNVTSIAVMPNGGHRLNMKDGTKGIPARGWIGIQFKADEWSF